MRSRRALILTCAAALSLGIDVPWRAGAQPAPARWTLTRDAFADLWYHGLALLGADDGYGPLPLYSSAYRADVRAARRARAGGVPSRLDEATAAMRAELRADSAYEVLHFVPPYFVGERPGTVLAALRRALARADGSGAPADGASEPLATRASAVVAALPSTRERRTLLAFLDLLDDEWRTFVRADRGARAPDRAMVARLQDEWDRAIAPPLASYLATLGGRAGGVVVVAPAVGAEGRIVTDGGAGRTVVVVTADEYGGAGSTSAPLLAAVRELAFPLLDAAPAPSGVGVRDRVGASRARDAAAVRAGALLLDVAGAAAVADAYRRFFVAAAASRGGSATSLERAYPVDAPTERALRSAVARYAAAPRAGSAFRR